jgi:hypothetical protein
MFWPLIYQTSMPVDPADIWAIVVDRDPPTAHGREWVKPPIFGDVTDRIP